MSVSMIIIMVGDIFYYIKMWILLENILANWIEANIFRVDTLKI